MLGVLELFVLFCPRLPVVKGGGGEGLGSTSPAPRPQTPDPREMKKAQGRSESVQPPSQGPFDFGVHV